MKLKGDIIKDILVPAAVLIAAILIWQLAAFIASAEVTPFLTIGTMVGVLGEGVFWRNFGFTVLRAFIAFAVSFILALILVVLSTWYGTIRRIFAPIMTAIRSLPTMAVVLILILTVSANTTTVLVGMLVLFPMFYSALLPTAMGVNKDLVEISLTAGANSLQRLKYVYLPAMTPAIVENGISGLSLAIKLVVSAEVLSQTAKSIGMMMQTAKAYLDLERLLALTMIVVVVCILIDLAGKSVYALVEKKIM